MNTTTAVRTGGITVISSVAIKVAKTVMVTGHLEVAGVIRFEKTTETAAKKK